MSDTTILSSQFQTYMYATHRAVPWYWVVTENTTSFGPSFRPNTSWNRITENYISLDNTSTWNIILLIWLMKVDCISTTYYLLRGKLEWFLVFFTASEWRPSGSSFTAPLHLICFFVCTCIIIRSLFTFSVLFRTVLWATGRARWLTTCCCCLLLLSGNRIMYKFNMYSHETVYPRMKGKPVRHLPFSPFDCSRLLSSTKSSLFVSLLSLACVF